MKFANATALGVLLALGSYSTGALADSRTMTVADSSDVVKEEAPLPGNRVEGGPNPRFDRQDGEASEVIDEKAPLPGNRVEGGPNPKFDRSSEGDSDVIEKKAPLPGNRVEGGPNPRFDRKPE